MSRFSFLVAGSAHIPVTSIGLGGSILIGLSIAAGCVQVLGIEDADCDPTYSLDCSSDETANANGGSGPFQMVAGLNPTGGSGGGGGAVGAAAGAGGTAVGTGNGTAAAGAGGSGGASGASGASASGGAAGSGMSGSAGAAGSGSMPVDPIVARASQLCLDYCDTVAASCTGRSQQYASQVACLAVCELLPPGVAGATSGNNVQCRMGQARLAASTGEPANYCFMAGPGGGGLCGTDCDGYCTMMTAKCQTQIGNLNQCLASCSIVPDLSLPPTNLRYDSSQQSGDSIQCRLFHVSAATVDPVGHCGHAAGATPCD